MSSGTDIFLFHVNKLHYPDYPHPPLGIAALCISIRDGADI